MKRLLPLLLLLLLPAAAALDLQVQLDAPEQLLPGEAGNATIRATINGVPVISFPLEATISYPDGTVLPLQLTNTHEGSYIATIYSVTEGTHTIDVEVPIDSETATATARVRVQKPHVGITASAAVQEGALTGTIRQESASDYTVEVAPLATGDLAQLTYAPLCSVSCGTECSFSCPVNQQTGVAKLTTRKGYTYTLYVPFGTGTPQLNVSYDAVSGVNEPLTVTTSRPAAAYTLFGSILTQMPLSGSSYAVTPQYPENGTVYVREGSALQGYPVQVIVRDNVEQLAPLRATDGVNSWWYSFVSTGGETLLRLPADPGTREAYLLESGKRTPLRWEKSYVVVPAMSGWVEVRQAQPASAPANQNETGYGFLVGGPGLQRHEFSGSIAAFDAALGALPVYSNGSSSVLYTLDGTAAVVQNAAGQLAISQPLRSGEQGAVQYSVQGSGDTAFSIYGYDGTLMQKLLFAGSAGTRELLFTMPAGRYIAVAAGETNAATSLTLYSDTPSITLSDGQRLVAAPNTEALISHTVTNNDLQRSRTVDILAEGAFTVLVNATDSDSDGMPDLLLAPGETKTFSSKVYIAPESTSGTITFSVFSDELNASVEDTISVQGIAVLTYVDADIVTIEGTQQQATVIIQNNHNAALPATLHINGPLLSTQMTTSLEPGLNNITLPDTGELVTVRLQVAGDSRPENNVRTRHFRTPYSTRLVHINERLHADHERYTVQLPRTPGFILTFIDAEGGERQASAMHSGEQTLWNIGPLAANQEFYAALLPGEAREEDFTTIIDNSNPYVMKKGVWVSSINTPGYIGFDYLLDLNIDKNAAVIYSPQLSHDRYSVSAHTPADPSFASNVPVSVHGVTSATVLLNQKVGGWQYLGLYELFPNSSVAIETARTTQFVAADAFSFTPISQIGGLVLSGNSTLDIAARVGKQASVHTGSYLDGILGLDAPKGVDVRQAGSTLHMTAADEGTYRIVASDGERTLTITLTVTQPLVYTSSGEEVPVRVALKRNGRTEKENLLPDQARAQRGRYEMEIDFPAGPISKLTIHDADPSHARVGVERVPNERARGQVEREVLDAFAINPGFNSSYTFTKTAAGRQLLKCTEYDFASQTCTGGFSPVRLLQPGKEYTVTFTPEDPLFLEVYDEILPPIYAECALAGTYAGANCLGTYDTTPTCSNERVWCDDSTNRESFTGDRNAIMGVQANYSDVNRDPAADCDVIKDVIVEYDVWESGPDTGLTYSLGVDADGDGFLNVRTGIAVPDVEGTRIQWNVTNSLIGGETWGCTDFFGPNATARARIEATRGGSGGPGASYTLQVDYLAFRLDYNYTAEAIETDFNQYVQGATVNMYGEDIWDPSALVTINVTRSGTLVTQLNATANGTGYFSTGFNLSDYAALGTYDIYAWQPSNTSLNASNNFTVIVRTPSISTQTVGDYFNRSQTVVFSGTQWAKSTSVTISATDPEGVAYTISPTANTTNSSGGLTYYWAVPNSLDLLTGPYAFTFVESTNASYNTSKTVYVVILPNTARDDSNADEIGNINKLDGVYASFIDDRAPTSTEYINMSFPAVVPTNGITLNALRLQFFHVEGASATNVYVQWLNSTSGSWSTICTVAARTIAGWDTCSLVNAITSSSDRNSMRLRLSDGGTDAWPSTPTYSFDISYLEVNFTFPPPNVSLISPPNNTQVNYSSYTLSYNATDQFYGISNCRVYVNSTLVHTNNSFAVNTSATYTHSFSEGNNSWYVACTDNSSRGLVGTSPTRYLLVDLTDPLSSYNTPAANYTWFNTTTPRVNFTANDNIDLTLDYTVFINGTVSGSGTMANASNVTHTFAAQTDGLKTAVLQVRDDVFRYATNKTVLFYVDTLAPAVNLISPVDAFNTSALGVDFSWNYTDALSPNATCLLLVDGVSSYTNASTLNATATSSGAIAVAEGDHNWTVRCTDLAGNMFQASPRDFTVDTSPPTVNLMSPANLTSFTTTRNVTLSYNVTDALTAVNICELHVEGSLNQSTASPAQDTELNFNLTDLDNGAYDWFVRCADNVTNWGYSENRTFAINVTVLAQSPAANAPLDRDGTDADPDSVALVANLTDGRSGATVSFYANLTQPAIAGQTGILLGSNTTNSSGHAVMYWNPDSTTYAGNYSWWAAEARSLSNNSLPVLVYGSLNLTYWSSTQEPDSEYNASQAVRAAFNITSYGLETDNVLDSEYSLTVAVNLTQPNGTVRVLTDARHNGSSWNTTYALSGDAEIGVWNSSAATNDSWFYLSMAAARNFTVKGLANAVSPANGTYVDRDGVDGTDSDTVTLVVHIPSATQPYTVNFTADLTEPVVAGQSGLLLGSNTTNSSGHAVMYWNPDSTTYAGNYTWRGVSAVSNVNQTSTLIVKGALAPVYSGATHPNSTYNITDTAVIEINITGYGPESRDNLSSPYSIAVQNTIANTSGSTDTDTLAYSSPTWSGSHVLLSLSGAGVWNTTANASGTYWYENSTNRTFTVYSHMNVTSNTTSPATIYAYQQATTACTVQDQHTQYSVAGANVTFYRNGVYLGWNTTDGSGSTELTFQVNTTGVHTITCNITDQPGIYYYRGDEHERNSTLTVLPFSVGAGGPANGSIVDRDSVAADPDLLSLNATVPSYIPDGETVLFYANISDPLTGQVEVLLGSNTTSSGSSMLHWNPNSTIGAGTWTWWANHSDGTANSTRTFIVKGGLAVAYNSSLHPNSTYFLNDTASVQVNVSAYGPESRDNLSSPYGIAVQNTLTNTTGGTSTATLSYTSPYWNATQALLAQRSVGVWNTTANASGTYQYENSTNRTFTVYGFMNITGNTTAPNTIFAFQSTTSACTVQDQHTQYSVAGANVTFYRNGVYLGWNTTDGSGSTELTFQVNTTGAHTITCNITDQPGIYYYRGDEPERNSTLTVLPFSVGVDGPANDTHVDRDGVDSTDPDVVTLNVTVPAWVPDGEMIRFYANLTQPAIAGQASVLLGSNTTSGGYASLHWDPNSTIYAGNWTWFANHSAGRSNSSLRFIVKGGGEISYRSAFHPNSTYFINDTARIEVNVSSYGPESRDNLSSPYGIAVQNTLTNTTGGTSTATLSYTSPYWNATQALLAQRSVGVWNTTANASGTYQYENSTNRTFTVYGFMNITGNTTSPDTIFAYQQATSTCTVQDQHTQYSVAGANVTFYRNGVYLGWNTTDGSGSTELTFQVNTTGAHTITCNITDQPSTYYYRGDEPERNSTLTVEAFPVTPVYPANGTQVDRDESNAGVVDVVMLNVTVPAWVPDGLIVNFTANLTDPAIAGQTDIILGANTTSGGSAVVWFNPNSSIYAGEWTWAGVHSAGTANGTRTVQVYGQLLAAYENSTYEPNSTYLQNDTLRVRLNGTSSGPETRNQMAATYSGLANATVQNASGSGAVFALSYTSPVWNGTYGLLGIDGVGLWNVTSNISAAYMFLNSTNRSFVVYGYMNVTSNTTAPASITAYEYATTTCAVQDQFTQYAVAGANVTFYRDGAYIGWNTTDADGAAIYAFQTNTTGTYTVICNVTDQPGIYYYRGDAPEGNSTLEVVPFRMEAASPVNNTIVDRDGVAADPDVVLLNITVESHVPDGIVIEFRANLSDPIIGGQSDVLLGTNTTSGASASYWFNPNSSLYAGSWTWFGNHSDGSVNSTRRVAVVGALDAVFRDGAAQPNATYNETDTVTLEANLTSRGVETRDELESLYGAANNATFTRPDGIDANRTLSYTSPYWNTTFRILDITGVGNWTAQVFSGADHFYGTNSSNRSFFVYSLANASEISLSQASIYAYETTTAQCRVINAVHGNPIGGYHVEFYRNSTNVGNGTTNATGYATLAFQTNTSGSYEVNCTIAQNLTAGYYVSQATANTTLLVSKVPVTPLSPLNDTRVDRDGAGADADSVLLNVTVPAGVPDGIAIEFRANLTEPSIGGQSGVLLGSNTTVGGFAHITLDPNSSMYAGNWSWYGLQSEADPNGTLRLHVIGSYAAEYADGSLHPNGTYFLNSTVTSLVNLTSAGPESRGELNGSYAASVNATAYNASGSGGAVAMVFNGTLWRNDTFSPLTLRGVGLWNHTVQTGAAHFYAAAVFNRTIAMYGFMNVTSNTTSPDTIFAYQQATSTCTVQDQHTQYSVAGANVTFYRNGTYIGWNTTDGSGTTELTFQVNTTGAHTITCNITDQPSTYYYRGDEPERNSTLTVEAFPVTPVYPANGTQVDRGGGSDAVDDVILLNVSVPAWVPDGLPVTFSSNLTDPLQHAAAALGSNTTNGSYAVLHYNPNSSSYAGIHTWYATVTSGATNGTRTYEEIGSLRIQFWNATYFPSANYTENETAALRLNLTPSDGPETAAEIAADYGGALNFSLASRNGQDGNTTAFSNPYWSGVYRLLALAGVGEWNVSSNAAASYFFPVDDAGAENNNGTVSSKAKISSTSGNFTGTLEANAYFGLGHAPIGDLDGDGNTDLAVGSPGVNGTRGAVHILFLNGSGAVRQRALIDNTSAPFIGYEGGDNFGWSVANIGDVDGDGVTDIAVGSPNDEEGDVNTGSVYVLFMNADGSLKAQQKISDVQGNVSIDLAGQFGEGLAGIGDLNGDGTPDLAVGAPRDNLGGFDRGSVYIIFLHPNGTAQGQQRIGQGTGGFSYTLDDTDYFGRMIGSVGDLDGDGVSDIAVGATSTGLTADPGSVYVLLMNADGTVKDDVQLTVNTNGFNEALPGGSLFGYPAGLGDVDGDSVPDMALGAAYADDGGANRGAVFIAFMNSNGSVKGTQRISSANGSFGAGLDDGDGFGASVSSLGDLDGDGITDIAVNAVLDDDGYGSAGALWLLFLNGTREQRQFDVYGYANVTEIDVTPNPIDAYNTAQYTCRVQNELTGVAAEGINVSFYFDGTLVGSNLTNGTGHSSVAHLESLQGAYEVRCNITDNLAAYYYAGSQQWLNATVNVTPILLTPIAPLNGTIVDRDDAGFASAETTLVGSVLSTVPDGITIDFWMNLTDPLLGGQSDIHLGSNVTNGSFVNLTVNPNSSLYAGNYTWFMNSSGGTANGTAHFLLYGTVNSTYASETEDPLPVYNKTLFADFVLNESSAGLETADELNATYSLTVNLTLTRPDGSTAVLQALYNGSQWNASLPLTGVPYGVWNTTATPLAPYFFASNTSLRNFTVFETTNLSVFDDEEYRGYILRANTVYGYFANYTNSTDEPVLGANCTMDLFEGPQAMAYNASSGLYERFALFSLEGVVRYNATCTMPFHYDGFDSDNGTLHSLANVSLTATMGDVAAGVREAVFNVTNLQNYTEHDIWLYHFVPGGFGAQYVTTPVDTQAVAGPAFLGNTTRWYIANLTAGQSTLVRYNVTGTANVSMLYDAALRVYTGNESVVY